MQYQDVNVRPCIRAGGRIIQLTLLASLVPAAWAQQASELTPVQTVTVTGYRGSLESSARDKKEATGFQDSIFAEDLGKFPDTNIAESLNRIPGVQVSREISGEGVNVQIRGLGTSFTKILLNGAPVAVASTGSTDSQNTNREVDLDLLPTDLFTKLTVSKSPSASLLEGGAAGVVDMRSARPFDRKGSYTAVNLGGTRNAVAKKWGNRGSVLASKTWDNTWGILGGVAWSKSKVLTTGYETIGFTNPNLSAAQNPSPTRNNTGGGNFSIPATVPSNAGNGLSPGAPIDQAFLLAQNPGLSIQQIDNALIPRLGRGMAQYGDKDKVTAILSGEFRPNADLHFYVDTMYSEKDNDLQRIDTAWIGRNGAVIPLNMKVDRSDCAAGCVVESGTFANAQFFAEYRPYLEDVRLKGINPGMEWHIGDKLKLNAQLNYTKSEFTRESPTVLPVTAPNSGTTVTFTNGAVPTIASSRDVSNPASFLLDTSAGGRVNLQQEKRETSTKGLRTDLSWGDRDFKLTGGYAYDDILRRITARDNSTAWQNLICGGVANCQGAGTVGARVGEYLTRGPNGLIAVDWARFAADTNYAQLLAEAPITGASNTGASTGFIQEKTHGAFLQVDGTTQLAGRQLRYNAGVRYVRTEQSVGAYNSVADPRNANLPAGTPPFPNVNQWVYVDKTYNNTLPSASAALDLAKDLVLRASASRTMTRANPDALRPGINFSNPSADIGSLGAPNLEPYLSDNLDLGLEWYTGREGYIAATVFQKKLNGFTVNQSTTQPFSSLAQYGVTYASLTPTQQQALDTRGGPDQATVVMTAQRNAGGKLKITGLELGWVQPLDRLLPWRGFGFSETLTLIDQKASGEGTQGFVALGVPKRSNNFQFYYENRGFMARLSHTYSEGSQVSGLNQNGIASAALFSDDFKQLDFSSSLDLASLLDRDGLPTLTFDVVNLTDTVRRTYFQFPNATFNSYKPGRTLAIGLRGRF
ncbi:TonB-dependent receptor [Massilia sp. KIM]|uniref:TonB-dependent receptor n=1 Tax=Massilia sp. KIM TaxID=1955422 RepID=UPI00098FCA8D|nr:TonB-dependent receptor [Massilia sp. KIM]OON62725.1 TonB-dependent receptor [Massilia sp. KIM]